MCISLRQKSQFTPSVLDFSLDVEVAVWLVVVPEDQICRFLPSARAVESLSLESLVFESERLAGLDGSEVRVFGLFVPENNLLGLAIVSGSHVQIRVHLGSNSKPLAVDVGDEPLRAVSLNVARHDFRALLLLVKYVHIELFVVRWPESEHALECLGASNSLVLDSLHASRHPGHLSHVAPWAVLGCCFNDFLIILPEVLGLFLILSVKEFSFLVDGVSHILFPFTFVDAAVSVFFDAKTVSLAVDEVAGVSRLIGPGHGSLALNIVLNKLALILFARLSKIVLTLSVELTVNEITLVNIAIEFKFTFTSLLAIHEVAGILDLIVLPLFGTFAVIHVVEPLAVIHRSVLVDEHTLSARLAFLPLTVVDVTIFVCNTSFSMEQALICHTLVNCSVGELDHAEAFPGRLVFVSLPLTLVFSSFANIHLESVPVVAFATALRTQLVSKIIIGEKRLFGRHELSFQVDWLLLSGNRQRLNHLLKSSSSNCALRPPLNGVHIFHFDFSFLHTMLVLDGRTSAAAHF